MQQQSQNRQISPTNRFHSNVSWVTKKVEYHKLSFLQLQQENRKILSTLKQLEDQLNNELSKKKLVTNKKITSPNIEVFQNTIQSNEKLISALKRQYDVSEQRKSILDEGLESKTSQKKKMVEKALQKIKKQIKELKGEQMIFTKKLEGRDYESLPVEHFDNKKLQEELRILQKKHGSLLRKHTKSEEKLSQNTLKGIMKVEIPSEIYEQELEKKEEEQFNEYENIIKFCEVLSHRNTSQSNKNYQKFNMKKKQLDQYDSKLQQLDALIRVFDGQIIESKKNVDLMKVKLQQVQEDPSKSKIRFSQGSNVMSSRRHSQSTTKLSKISSQNKKIVDFGHKNPFLRNRIQSLNKIQVPL